MNIAVHADLIATRASELAQGPVARCAGFAEPGRTPDAGADRAALHARLGYTDHVTLLPNRISCIADLAALEDGAERMLVLLTLADAAHFNAILRALGHAFADDLVRAGASLVRALLPPETVLYHVSVLSFAFLHPMDDLAATPSVAVDLAHIFARPIQCHGVPIAARVGIGLYPLDGLAIAPAEALRGALAAAQDSRSQSKGIARYNQASDAAHLRSFGLLADLREALVREGELSLHYQPRIDLDTGGLNSAEMLLRWTHPRLGPISPAEFIPLVETTGLMAPLTDWILTQGLRQLRVWRDQGNPVKASINIAPSSLRAPGFVDRIATLMEAFSVPAELVELEFTEGTLASVEPVVLRQIEEIRAHGIGIAIDDFGTGYSNLDYLTRLPAQVLKIDKSFIQPLERSRRSRVLVRGLIDLAHGLGYCVVAEGVETEACCTLLRDWGCEQGQGYLISRPLPVAQFQAWREARGVGQNTAGV